MGQPIFSAGPCWEVTPAQSLSSFVRALITLEWANSVLYIESGTRAPSELDSYLRENAIEQPTRIKGGTVLPRPIVYCVPATIETLTDIGNIAENLTTPIGSIHIHIYQKENMLLQWFDAFLDPIWISIDVPESKIEEFSRELGSSYTRHAC